MQPDFLRDIMENTLKHIIVCMLYYIIKIGCAGAQIHEPTEASRNQA